MRSILGGVIDFMVLRVAFAATDLRSPSMPMTNSCYSPEGMKALGSQVFLNLPQIKSFAGMALGAGALSGFVALKTLQDYQDGKFKYIIASGGVVVRNSDYYEQLIPLMQAAGLPEPGETETEGAYMTRILLDRGVSLSVIETEEKSTNTGENIANCLPWLEDSPTVTFVCLAHLQRRVLGTFRVHLDTPATTSAVYPFPGVDQNNWHNAPDPFGRIVRSEVLSEIQKIDPYIAQGFCKPVDDVDERKTLTMISNLQKYFILSKLSL